MVYALLEAINLVFGVKFLDLGPYLIWICDGVCSREYRIMEFCQHLII